LAGMRSLLEMIRAASVEARRSTHFVAPKLGRGGNHYIAARDRCVCQIAIPGDRDEPCVFDADRGGEVNRVVPAQAMKLGELASEVRQRVVDAYDAKLGVQVVDRTYCFTQRACLDATRT